MLLFRAVSETNVEEDAYVKVWAWTGDGCDLECCDRFLIFCTVHSSGGERARNRRANSRSGSNTSCGWRSRAADAMSYGKALVRQSRVFLMLFSGRFLTVGFQGVPLC